MAGTLYALDGPEAMRLVALDSLSVLYHRPSGTTHILAPPAPEILAALRDGPATPAELIARLQACFELEEDAGAYEIEARLAELEQAGLVRRA